MSTELHIGSYGWYVVSASQTLGAKVVDTMGLTQANMGGKLLPAQSVHHFWGKFSGRSKKEVRIIWAASISSRFLRFFALSPPSIK